MLSRETGYHRPYGQNPYAGYDDVRSSPFLYEVPETPGVPPPMARMPTVDLEGEADLSAYLAVLARRFRGVSPHPRLPACQPPPVGV